MPLVTPGVAIAAGGMLLNLFILPTVLDPEAKVPRTQSVSSALVLLFLFTIPYLYLGMVLSATSTFIGSLLWGFVALRRA